MPLQQEHQQELLTFLSPEILEAESLEQAKEMLTTTFIKKSEAAKDEEVRKQVSGSLLGKLDTFVNQKAKELNVEFDEQIKSGKLEDKLNFLTSKTSETINTYKSQIDAGIDDKFKEKIEAEYKGKVEKLQSDLQYKSELLDKSVNELTAFKTDFQTKERKRIIGDAYNQAKLTLKLSPEVDELKVKGFESVFREKYVTDLDENNSVIVLDAKTQKPIPNPNKMNETLGLSDILKNEAEQYGLLQKNPAANTRVPNPSSYKGQEPPNPLQQKRSSKISPLAMGS